MNDSDTNAILVVKLNLDIDRRIFELDLTQKVSEYENLTGISLNSERKDVSTKRGMSLIKYNVTRDDGCTDFVMSFVAEKVSPNRIRIGDTKLSDFNDSFFNVSYGAADMFLTLLKDECVSNYGDFVACKHDGTDQAIVVDNGNLIPAKVKRYITTKKGNYNIKDGSYSGIHSFEDSSNYALDVEEDLYAWVKKNEGLSKMIAKMNNAQKIETIASYILTKKLKRDIPSNKFISLFKQASDMSEMFGSFSNETVEQLRKLFTDSDYEENDDE